MKIQPLLCFDAVVKTGSFRAAAQRLHKTQPALTKSIRLLEESLGFELLDRAQYRPVLTSKGQIFHAALQTYLGNMEKLAALTAYLQKDYETHYSIAIDMACPLQCITDTLQQVFNSFDKTQFNLVTTAINGGNELLMQQQVDLAINEHLYLDSDFEAHPLTTIPLVPVVSPAYYEKHSLAFTHSEQLPALLQIIVQDSAQHHKYSFGLIPGAPQCLVSDIYNKHSLIRQGLGWGRLPEHLVAADLAAGHLINLTNHHPYITTRHLPVSIIRRRAYQHGPIAQLIWQQLTSSHALST